MGQLSPRRPRVVIVHDYLTQLGGGERVVLSMLKAFPDAPVYTALFDPAKTFPAFADVDVRTLPLNRIRFLREHSRRAFPVLAPAFSRLRVEADVTICSTTGWSHGTHVSGRKVVYCHSPAKWLYQPGRYFGEGRWLVRLGLSGMRPFLRAWDRRAARSASRYLANSTAIRDRIAELYGIRAEVIAPPPILDPAGPSTPVPGLGSEFVLCVSRLLPYKNVDAVVDAFRELDCQLVVVGSGPEERRLRARAPGNVRLLGTVPDEQLCWLYSRCAGIVAASYEDFGLTPLEAASYGKPTAALRAGGFLDTVVEGTTGVFFDEPRPDAIRAAVVTLLTTPWDPEVLSRHAGLFSESRFITHLRRVVLAEAGKA